MIINSYVFSAAGPSILYATLNPADKSGNVNLSGGNLTAVRDSGTGTSGPWATVRTTIGKAAGKWYFELLNNANGSTGGDAMWGFMTSMDSLSTYPGNTSLGANTMGWEANLSPDSGKFQNGYQGAASGYGTVAPGGYSYFAIDFDAGKLWIKNSSGSGWAGGGDPATGTSPTFTFSANTALNVAVAGYSSPQSVTANFGATMFNSSVPSGFNSGWYGLPSIGALVFDSRFSVSGVTNDIQGVVTDGTNIWISSSSTIYVTDMSGAVITSRNVSGDNPTGKSQINGLALQGGSLFVSAAVYSGSGTSWIVEYNPTTLAYIADHTITGDWFSEGLEFKDGYWWVCFHANRLMAKVDPTTWGVVETYPLSFGITGSSGGYGPGTGYDGMAWRGDYMLLNIHEIYDQAYTDVYYFDGTRFVEVQRLAQPTISATQGFCINPMDSTQFLYAERNNPGTDSIAFVSLV